jgi:protein SCO1/2
MNPFESFSSARRRLLQRGLLVACGVSPIGRGAAAHEGHHAKTGEQEAYVRRTAHYAVPDVQLRDTEGARVALRASLADKPVILNFIFTTCDTTCPVTSQTFSQVQEGLGSARSMVRMVSISIDPEQDTPAALKAYAAKFGAGPQWQMLTGTVGDSIAVQRAFDAYRGDKMNHQPATFLRARPGQPWVRLDGFASAADIVSEYHKLRA